MHLPIFKRYAHETLLGVTREKCFGFLAVAGDGRSRCRDNRIEGITLRPSGRARTASQPGVYGNRRRVIGSRFPYGGLKAGSVTELAEIGDSCLAGG